MEKEKNIIKKKFMKENLMVVVKMDMEKYILTMEINMKANIIYYDTIYGYGIYYFSNGVKYLNHLILLSVYFLIFLF